MAIENRVPGNTQGIRWAGPGWYGPIAEGPGWTLTVYYKIAGIDLYDANGNLVPDDQGYPDRIWDWSRRLGLGTPTLIEVIKEGDWDSVF